MRKTLFQRRPNAATLPPPNQSRRPREPPKSSPPLNLPHHHRTLSNQIYGCSKSVFATVHQSQWLAGELTLVFRRRRKREGTETTLGTYWTSPLSPTRFVFACVQNRRITFTHSSLQYPLRTSISREWEVIIAMYCKCNTELGVHTRISCFAVWYISTSPHRRYT